jgi:hypothetical protein
MMEGLKRPASLRNKWRGAIAFGKKPGITPRLIDQKSDQASDANAAVICKVRTLPVAL